MSPHTITKILSVVSLAALVIMPVQETAYARSVTGGGTGSTNTTDTYQAIWNGPLSTQASNRGISGGSSNESHGITGGGSTSGSRGINGGASSSASRGITGGGSTSGDRGINGGNSNNSGNGSSLIPGGYQYDASRGVTGGGSTSGSRGINGGGSSNGSRGISGGNSNSSYGSSLIPGGYQYDASRGINGGGSSNSGRGITGGGSTSENRGISGGNSNNSGNGSSLIPGGYQYDASRGINGGNSSNGDRGISGGGSSNGDRGITGGGSTNGDRGISGGNPNNSGNGSSLIPGGYQYDASRGITGGGSSNGGREITGGGSSNGDREITGGGSSNGDREITGGGSNNNDREITGGGVASCGYGSSLIPGGYQYCANGIGGNDDDVTPVQEAQYYACREVSTNNRIYKSSRTGIDSTFTTYYNEHGHKIEEGETGAGAYPQYIFQTKVYECYKISYSEFLSETDDVTPVEENKYYACEDNNDVMYMKLTQDGDDYTARLYEEGEGHAYFISRDMTGEEAAEFIADKQEDYDCDRISRSEFEDGLENNDDDDDQDRSTCNNREYPEDVDGHWSEIYVRRLYDLCVTEGYNDGSFRPNQNVTRAELVKMGLYANGLEPNDGCYDNDCGSPYSDLDEWQGPWVRTAYDRDIVEGYANEKFRPNQYITRAEAVKVVLATYGYRPLSVNKSFFNDVNGWSTGWIEQARVIGMVQGIGNGNFDPNRPITRAEAAKIIVKMIEHWDTEIK